MCDSHTRASHAQNDDVNVSDCQLRHVSERDKGWDVKRHTANLIVDFWDANSEYEGDRFSKYRDRIRACAGTLQFAEMLTEYGEIVYNLKHAVFCRGPGCVICMWRRSMKLVAKFYGLLPQLLRDYPTGRWLHVTLTVRNCDVADLAATLDKMNHAWRLFVLRKEFTDNKLIIGWVRSIEVTRGQDGPMQYHPHFHVLLFMKSSYFGGRGDYYMPALICKERAKPVLKKGEPVKGRDGKPKTTTRKSWQRVWKECMGIDYDPSIHVSAVRLKSTKKDGLGEVLYFDAMPEGVDPEAYKIGLAGSLEVFKYCTKPADLVPQTPDDPWLLGLFEGIFNRNLVTTGGVIKKIVAANEEARKAENLLQVSDKSADTARLSNMSKAYSHTVIDGKVRYVRAKSKDVNLDDQAALVRSVRPSSPSILAERSVNKRIRARVLIKAEIIAEALAAEALATENFTLSL